jgi:hypothetical protein
MIKKTNFYSEMVLFKPSHKLCTYFDKYERGKQVRYKKWHRINYELVKYTLK